MERSNPEAAYIALRRTVMAAGLLDRTYRYYAGLGLFAFAMFLLPIFLAMVLPAQPVWTGLLAILFGFATVQVGLVGHDAGHKAVFRSWRANQVLGQLCWTLSVGVSFWYWCDRHNRHHAHTNDATGDPDLNGGGLIAFSEADAASRQGWRRTIARYQTAFTPLILLFMLFFGFILKLEGLLFTLRRLQGRRRTVEMALLALNGVCAFLPVLFLEDRWAWIWAGGTMVAGFYLSLIVAPNHKGMPVWARGQEPSFLQRQVLSSRNVTSHPVWDLLFGGLNYQIEHHLFPTMPRAHFRQAQTIVKSFCAAHSLEYEELGPLASYRKAFAQLNRISRAAL